MIRSEDARKQRSESGGLASAAFRYVILLDREAVLTMTFLKTRYRTSRALTSEEIERSADLSTTYGIRGVDFEGDDLVIEYDASRIHEAEVLAAVRRAGLPVAPIEPIPMGGFDQTGEFRDFAWPTSGLSPANQKP
ncbi:MAG TPA: hypothetical protein VGZ29_09975 [Terriglobia bacterium]|nr:hypothetical protein [Terriglobia bacterium]